MLWKSKKDMLSDVFEPTRFHLTKLQQDIMNEVMELRNS